MYTDINTLNIYLLYTSSLKFEEGFLNLIEDRRINGILSSTNESFKVRSLYAGLLLRYALKAEGEVVETPLKIEYNKYGKPYLPEKNIEFNISHSGNFIAVVVAKTNVGLDIEVVKNKTYDKVAEKILSCDEIQDYKNSTAPYEYFTSCWVKKESYLKFKGTGINCKLNGICLSRLDGYSQCFSLIEKKGIKLALATTMQMPHANKIICVESSKVT